MVHSYLIINSNPENGFDKTFEQTQNYELSLLFRDICINCCSIYTILCRAIVWSQSLTSVEISKINEDVHNEKFVRYKHSIHFSGSTLKYSSKYFTEE